MLTAEAQRPIISRVLKSGITDYMVKPFDPEDLRSKVMALVQRNAEEVVDARAPTGAGAEAIWQKQACSRRRQIVDVMVVDDMENVRRRLRGMLPKHVTLDGFTCAQSALASSREKSYRAIFIDTEMPDVDSLVLAQQMRQLHPHAAIAALAMRANAADQAKKLKEQGFGFVLYKPFTQDQLDDFVGRYLENQEYLVREDNLLKLAPTMVRAEQRERYFKRLDLLLAAALKEAACASYAEVIVDAGRIEIGGVPSQGDMLPSLLASAAAQASDYGMSLSVVGSDALRKVLAAYEETSGIPWFPTLQEARAPRPPQGEARALRAS
jgi:DNA-binding NtrC family response regulator